LGYRPALLSFILSVLKTMRPHIKYVSDPFFSHLFNNGSAEFYYMFIIISAVRNRAAGTVFDAVFPEFKIAAAFFAQCIQGTVAEQTVELFLRDTLVAGEIFTVRVAEKMAVVFQLHFSDISFVNFQ